MSLYIAIFMNDLATQIKNLGLGMRVGDHDPFHTSIMHKIKTKQVTGLGVAVEKREKGLVEKRPCGNKALW